MDGSTTIQEEDDSQIILKPPVIPTNTNEAVTSGLKFDSDKSRIDLIDAESIEELGHVLAFGAKKYAAHNWRKGITLSRLTAAAGRHLFAIMRGEDKDQETGRQHAAHLMCCAMFIIWMIKNRPDMDDRWKKPSGDR